MVVLIRIIGIILSGAKPKRLFYSTKPNLHVGKYFLTHESYNYEVGIKDGNDILFSYQIYRAQKR